MVIWPELGHLIPPHGAEGLVRNPGVSLDAPVFPHHGALTIVSVVGGFRTIEKPYYYYYYWLRWWAHDWHNLQHLLCWTALLGLKICCIGVYGHGWHHPLVEVPY